MRGEQGKRTAMSAFFAAGVTRLAGNGQGSRRRMAGAGA